MNPTALEASRQFNRAADRLPTLFNLSEDFEQLLTLLEDPEADQAEVLAEMDRTIGDIRQKAYGVAVILNGLDKLAEHQRSESRRLAEKARANEAHADRLRAYAMRCMEIADLRRIETGTFTLAIRSNPPSVNVVDATAVPSEFQRTKVTVDVDKRAVLEAYKATGEIPPGVDVQRSQSLRVS